MEIPESYHGREQTWLKHQVLKAYIQAWAMKLSSFARTVWFVDCFAGPWRAGDAELQDTSVAIALDALNEAQAYWRSKGHDVCAKSIFVEADSRAYQRLESFVAEKDREVEAVSLHGAFAEQVPTIQQLIGKDPAFIFVDPTGWKGVAMESIAKLARDPRRDLMVNVMYDHINRFKDDERAFLREQMAEFFGIPIGSLQPELNEEELMKFYRDRLRDSSSMNLVADLTVPVPTRNRTYFRLVLGTNHQAGLALFRDIESTVAGKKAASARAGAKQRLNERGGQTSLLAQPVAPEDHHYAMQRERGICMVCEYLPKLLAREGPTAFGKIWPRILQVCHMTQTQLRSCLRELHENGVIVLPDAGHGRKKLSDNDIIRLAP